MSSKRDTKNEIIKTATKLFWEKSYNAVSVDSICKESGIRKGSFYHYFPSKDAMALEILDELWQQHKDHFIPPTFDKDIPPLERFTRLANALGDTACRVKNNSGHFFGCPFGNFAGELSTQNEHIRRKIEYIFSEYAKYFEEALQDGVNKGVLSDHMDPQAISQLLISCLQGSFLISKTRNTPEILRNHFQTLLNSVFAQYRVTTPEVSKAA